MDYKEAPPQDHDEYMDSDDEEELVLTHADHKENGNISYKAKGEYSICSDRSFFKYSNQYTINR